MHVHALLTIVAVVALAALAVGASPVQAKAPPSAYGSSFDEGSASGGSPDAVDDIDEEENAPRKRKQEEPTYRRPRAGKKVKVILDGDVGDSSVETGGDD